MPARWPRSRCQAWVENREQQNQLSVVCHRHGGPNHLHQIRPRLAESAAKRSAAWSISACGADRGSGWRCRRDSCSYGRSGPPTQANALWIGGVGQGNPSAPRAWPSMKSAGSSRAARDDQGGHDTAAPRRSKMGRRARRQCGIVGTRCDHENSKGAPPVPHRVPSR